SRAPPGGSRRRRGARMSTAAADIPLLERGEELARIESLLGRVRDGRGSFLVLEGPAGIGKTTLLTAARTVAAAQGMNALRSRGAGLDRALPFGAVRRLFEP